MQLSPEQVQSVNIILSAVQVAQRRGAFSLQDAHTLQDAIDKLVPREEQERQAQEAKEAQASGDEAEAVSLSEEVVEESE
jgi:thioredoxin-like negative regulator of GroEL|tara:strand:+ start:1454 stop:1693 length:240 start_codon:yes stop_codon:yes gene_type:complete